jgi:signal transduction histidine kinase
MLSSPTLAVPRRIVVWAVLLAAAVLACLSLAVIVRRQTSGAVQQLANAEFAATNVRAQQFGADLDDVRDALQKLGTASGASSPGIIQQRRQRLNEWLSTRQQSARSEGERTILRQLATETRNFYSDLDAASAHGQELKRPLDESLLARFDGELTRLRSLAGYYSAVHNDVLHDLLQTSLGSVLWMRDLVFACVALLLGAIGLVVLLLYRDVVRPLRGRLIESEKLAALGTLAAGVAHEIRNPLTAIKARIYTLRRTLTSEESKDDAQAIALEVDRLERVVRDVLGYARPAEPALSPVELSSWLREFAAFVAPEMAARRIELSVAVAGPATVRSDPNQLQQIMLNLVRNAQEALEGRIGRIELALARERAQSRGPVRELAVLTVADNGPGIPSKIQSRLFDPFFTTKAAGTGLGLSIVSRLVENLGGRIGFQSTPRLGTRFAVRLPIDENPTN